MHQFPFNQPENTRDCGHRCLYWALKPTQTRKGYQTLIPYDAWLADSFKMLNPAEAGITFDNIHHILKHHNVEHRFTQLTERGLYLIYSGVWMKQYDKKHGHYFCYDNGVVLCSTREGPERRSIADVLHHLEAKTIEGAFRCMRIGE